MFNPAGWGATSASLSGLVPRSYEYINTEDTIATMSATGYFNAKLTYVKVGDRIWVVASNGYAQFVITSVANNTIQVSASAADVTGPVSSFDNAITLFSGTTGSVLKTIDFVPTANSIFGFNNTATPSQVDIGAGLTLIDGILAASGGAGTGNVIGPVSSTAGGVAFFDGTTGELLQDSPFTPAADSLLGYDDSGLPINITTGTNVNITDGVLEFTGSGSGDVNGPGSSVAERMPVFADTTGKLLKQGSVLITNGTILGVNGGVITNITAGTGITISGGQISAAGTGTGTVTGPISSTVGSLAFWNNTTGTLLGNTPFSITNGSLLGFDSTGKPANVTAGPGISITANVISAAGAGTGDVTGPTTSIDGGLVLYSGLTGKILENTAYTVLPNTLIGYNSSAQVNGINLGQGMALATPGGGSQTLIYNMQLVNTASAVAIALTSNNTYYAVSNASTVTQSLPAAAGIPPGFTCRFLNASNNSSQVRIATSDSSQIGYLSTLGVPSFTTLLLVKTFGVVTITRVGQDGGAISTRWWADGDIAS